MKYILAFLLCFNCFAAKYKVGDCFTYKKAVTIEIQKVTETRYYLFCSAWFGEENRDYKIVDFEGWIDKEGLIVYNCKEG